MGSPNPIAYAMLLIWPLIAWQLWRRLPPGQALVWTILAGYLALPELAAFNLPIIPDFNKVSIPNLVALCAVLFLLGQRVSYWPASWIGRLLILIYVLSPFMTVMTNSEPVFWGLNMIDGMRFYDSFAAVTYQAIYLIPYFLARKLLAGPEGAETILKALILAGLVYSLPMLFEVRFSPQLHKWIYGVFQHDFSQTMRYGGFRPVVFLKHGLWVAMFCVMAVIAAGHVLRLTPAQDRPKAAFILTWLLFALLLCKSAGPLIFAACALPLALLAPRKWMVYVAAGLAAIVVTYPLLRGLHLFPIEQVQDMAKALGPDRAHSFNFRINNEEQLLAWAEQKPWFGWGGYARNLIHDAETGRILTIADGAWIIVMGIYGWAGFAGEFGLLALPLLLLAREVWSAPATAISLSTATLALILGVSMVDFLPNATGIPFTWLISGALLGETERLARLRRAGEWRKAPVPVLRPRKTVI